MFLVALHAAEATADGVLGGDAQRALQERPLVERRRGRAAAPARVLALVPRERERVEGVGGGVYLWESREAAEAAYSDEWKAYMTEKYNHSPKLVFYEAPITMDRQYNTVYDESAVPQAAE